MKPLLRPLGGITRRDERVNHLPRVDGPYTSFLIALGCLSEYSDGLRPPYSRTPQPGRTPSPTTPP